MLRRGGEGGWSGRSRDLCTPANSCTPAADLSPVGAARGAATRRRPWPGPRRRGSGWSPGPGSPGRGAGGSASGVYGRRERPASGPGGAAMPVWTRSAGIRLIPATVATPAGPWNPRGAGELKMRGEVGARGGGAGWALSRPAPNRDTPETSRWRPVAVRSTRDRRSHHHPSPTPRPNKAQAAMRQLRLLRVIRFWPCPPLPNEPLGSTPCSSGSAPHTGHAPRRHHRDPLCPHLPSSGTLRDVSGIFWAIRNKKTVWASRTLMETVHFWPPAGGSAW